MLQIGQRVIVNDNVNPQLTIQPGITGTILNINTYNDGEVEYRVLLDFNEISYFGQTMICSGHMWDWFNANEVEIFTGTPKVETIK